MDKWFVIRKKMGCGKIIAKITAVLHPFCTFCSDFCSSFYLKVELIAPPLNQSWVYASGPVKFCRHASVTAQSLGLKRSYMLPVYLLESIYLIYLLLWFALTSLWETHGPATHVTLTNNRLTARYTSEVLLELWPFATSPAEHRCMSSAEPGPD